MGRSRGLKRDNKPAEGRWPPELRDLQRRGGMSPDWHEATHGRSRGVAGFSDPDVALEERLRKAKEFELEDIWQEALHRWPENIHPPEDVKKKWLRSSKTKIHLEKSPHFPGTFLITPAYNESVAQNLQKWLQDDPEAFWQFAEEEVLPGIEGIAPIGGQVHAALPALMTEMLSQKYPDYLGGLHVLDRSRFASWEAAPYYYGWNFWRARNEGSSPKEAELCAVRETIKEFYARIALDEELFAYLRDQFPELRELRRYPREREFWKTFRGFFETDQWPDFVAGKIPLDIMIRDFFIEHFGLEV